MTPKPKEIVTWVYVTTQEEFDEILRIFSKRKWKWKSGDSALSLKNNFLVHKKDTLIEVKDKFQFSNIRWGASIEREVLNYEEFLKRESLV